ncbi:MAG: penicillin-binding transpeptidase domain-containing protein [Eubacterium sp.]|nr:penicillin-binding transpeptidase domain-containing protein [Eubacterium sp.]
MVKKIKKVIKNIFAERAGILLVLFAVMGAVIIARLFDLQIIHGKDYADNFTIKTTRTKTLKSTRGNIYDCNGNLLAYNKLSNSITIEDSGTYDTTREKNLTLNGEIYRLIKMIRNTGSTPTHDFHIILDENGLFAFDTDNQTTINRFRADVYGYQTVDEMSEEEKTADPAQIMEDLESAKGFALVNEDKPYTVEELAKAGLPTDLSNQDKLDIVIVRYQLRLISYQRYMAVTVAENATDETVAAVSENKDTMEGVGISEDYIRVYDDSESMAPILGYTGRPSSDELKDLQKQNSKYNSNSVIGKAGIEQYMETTLQGTDGSEEVIVNNLGRVLEENKESLVEPVQGNDVHLTIDKDLQNACYQILEQRIAGIVLTYLVDAKEIDRTGQNYHDTVYIPVYDVYRHMISNGVIDISHFTAEDASDTEKAIRSAFESRSTEVLQWIGDSLADPSGTAYNDLTDEQKAYVNYIYSDFLLNQEGILNRDKIDVNDETYQAYTTDGSISLGEFLHYACNEGWINLSAFSDDQEYVTADEIYQNIADYIQNHILNYTSFQKIIYEYMLMDDVISPANILTVLYDQGVLDKNDGQYSQFISGGISSYDLVYSKITSLELTPAMCAVDPCSGSMVITDPDTGVVKACVSYPGYDNNRLANTLDTDYYYKLTIDKSSPFYNKATQQLTAPGSTFKPVMVAAGITEGVIDNDTEVYCDGKFGRDFLDEGDQLNCWLLTGHGSMNVITGLAHSCNVFFCTVGYRLGEKNASGTYDAGLSLSTIIDYASKFGLDKSTGIQMAESKPHVTDSLPIPSSIGQGTHTYTTSQLARYASVLATKGIVNNLTLIDKVTDSSGAVMKEFTSETIKDTDFSSLVWNDIWQGMEGAMEEEGDIFTDLPFTLYGKTGTAQESEERPSHSIVLGFSDYKGTKIAFTVRIAFGHGSKNACLTARDMLDYVYRLKDDSETLTGQANVDGMVTQESSD